MPKGEKKLLSLATHRRRRQRFARGHCPFFALTRDAQGPHRQAGLATPQVGDPVEVLDLRVVRALLQQGFQGLERDVGRRLG